MSVCRASVVCEEVREPVVARMMVDWATAALPPIADPAPHPASSRAAILEGLKAAAAVKQPHDSARSLVLKTVRRSFTAAQHRCIGSKRTETAVVAALYMPLGASYDCLHAHWRFRRAQLRRDGYLSIFCERANTRTAHARP